MTVQEFLYGGILDEQIVEGLAWQYPGSSDSQIRAWRDLVQRLRNCDRLRYLPGSCVIVLEYELPSLNYLDCTLQRPRQSVLL